MMLSFILGSVLIKSAISSNFFNNSRLSFELFNSNITSSDRLFILARISAFTKFSSAFCSSVFSISTLLSGPFVLDAVVDFLTTAVFLESISFVFSVLASSSFLFVTTVSPCFTFAQLIYFLVLVLDDDEASRFSHDPLISMAAANFFKFSLIFTPVSFNVDLMAAVELAAAEKLG